MNMSLSNTKIMYAGVERASTKAPAAPWELKEVDGNLEEQVGDITQSS